MRRGKIVLILLLAAIACFLAGVLLWGIRAGQGDFGESLAAELFPGAGRAHPGSGSRRDPGRSVWITVP